MNALAWSNRTRIGAESLEIRLRGAGPLRLTRGRGRQILCTEGCAWITAPGEPDDIYLRAGEAWRINSDGLVLVEAVGLAAVRLGASESGRIR